MTKQPKSHKLKVVTDEEINEALKFQKEHSDWNFYAERELLESVINQRINFLIAVFALFITAAASVNNIQNLIIVLGSGSILVLCLIFSIYRVHIRLDIVQKILYKAEGLHVLPVVQKEIDAYKYKIIGKATVLTHIIIPVLCFAMLIFGCFAACCGCISLEPDAPKN